MTVLASDYLLLELRLLDKGGLGFFLSYSFDLGQQPPSGSRMHGKAMEVGI
ncbi:MAG: hypothetical protein ACREJD_00015 [Phycisphaerales bacterium]